jgi:hypothetical protein
MARGWESKSVEAQQEDTERIRRPEKDRPLGGEERARFERRRVLELARARTAADLARAARPAQRDMLARALADLDEQLRALGA